MQVRFWGVRGSVPWATPLSIGIGCNTPCVELRDETSGCLLVLDAGSGIVGLGESLGGRPPAVPILLTHYHWDHVQGLPFFAPIFVPGCAVTIWAPALGAQSSIEAIFASPYFPVPYLRLPVQPRIEVVGPGERRVGDFDVRAQPLNHPGGALAYRIRGREGDLVYATDHEFGDEAIDRQVAAFIAGARDVILDAHFTPDEMPAHRGWGHSDWAQCARLAAAQGVGRLWLFHHKPGRPDRDLREIESDARRIFPATELAAEGKCFSV